MSLRTQWHQIRLILATSLVLTGLGVSVASVLANASSNLLSDVQILLPHSEYAYARTNFTLRALHGCYDWAVTDSSLVTLEPLACSGGTSEVVVGSISTKPERNPARIIATEKTTNTKLFCEVHVRDIKRIEIATTSRELTFDMVEDIFIQAYDEDNNLFSSLDGLKFNWSVERSDGVSSGDILEIVDFADSQYKATDTELEMESLGLRGPKILVKGISTGKGRITATYQSATYGLLQSTVEVMVMDPFMLLPMSPLFVQRGDMFMIKIIRIRQQNLELTLPNNSFKAMVEDEGVAVLRNTGHLEALELGTTRVVVEDVKADNRKETSEIHVVNAHTADLRIMSMENGKEVKQTQNRGFILIQGYRYVAQYIVKDKENHVMYMGLNFLLDIDPPLVTDYHFRDVTASRNATYYELTADKQGIRKLKAKIEETGREVQHTIQIDTPISLDPNPAVLPLGGVGSFQLHASKFPFICNLVDGASVQVDTDGRLKPLAIGTSHGVCYDAINAENQAPFTVQVLGVASIEFVSMADTTYSTMSHLSIEAGGEQKVGIRAVRSDGKYFSGCGFLPFHFLNNADGVVVAEDSEPVSAGYEMGGICRMFVVRGRSQGSTSVSAYLEIEDQPRSRLEITVHEKLELLYPQQESILITKGASYDIITQGGPSDGKLITIESSKENKIRIESLGMVPSSGLVKRKWRVTCLDHVEDTLELREKASGSKSLVVHSIAYQCADPQSLDVVPRDAVSDPACGSDIFASPLSDLALVLDFKDATQRSFDNNTSLEAACSTHTTRPVSMSVQKVPAKGHIMCVVTYKGDVEEDMEKVAVEASAGKLKGRVDISFKPNTRASRSELVTFPDNTEPRMVTFLGGSGNFVIEQTLGDRNVEARIFNNMLQIMPKALGVTELVVRDRCVVGAGQVKISVIVDKPSFVEVDPAAHIYVAAGDHMSNLYVRVVGVTNHAFDAEEYGGLKVHAEHSSGSFTVEPCRTDDGGMAVTAMGQLFNITGITPGEGRVTFRLGSGSESSDYVDVSVYEPIAFSPKEIVLIPGSQFQPLLTGGVPQITPTFSSGADDIVSVDPHGLITANKIGRTEITATFRQPRGFSAMFSSDTMDVNVVDMRSVVIHAPRKIFTTGADVVVHVEGEMNETPFSVAGAECSFRWTSDDTSVIDLRSIHGESTESLGIEADFSVRILANNPGSAFVSVSVECPYFPAGRSIRARRQFEVVEEFVLEGPQKLILPVGSAYQLNPNHSATFKVIGDGLVTKKQGITVDASGLITTSQSPGTFGVLMASQHRGLNQTMIATVEVKRPVGLSLEPVEGSAVMNPIGGRGGIREQLMLPLGMEQEVVVRLHDDLGRTFTTAAYVNLDVSSNRHDVLAVEHNQETGRLLVKALQRGNEVLKVGLKRQADAADYLRVRVAYGIRPAEAIVSLGSRVCFGVDDSITSGGVSGTNWSSGNEEILRIDSDGYADAVGYGETTITYESKFQTRTQAHVAHVKSVNFELPDDMVINNLMGDKEAEYQDIPVVVKARLDNQPAGDYDQTFSVLPPCQGFQGAMGLPAVNVTCEVLDYADWFEVTSGHIDAHGRYTCRLRAIDMSEDSATVTSISIKVSASDMVGAERVTEVVSVPFQAAFVVTTVGDEITASEADGGIVVRGPPVIIDHLHVTTDKSGRFIIEKGGALATSCPRGLRNADGSCSGTSFTLRPYHSIYEPEDVRVHFRSAKTGQTQTVSLRYNPMDRPRMSGGKGIDISLYVPQWATILLPLLLAGVGLLYATSRTTTVWLSSERSYGENIALSPQAAMSPFPRGRDTFNTPSRNSPIGGPSPYRSSLFRRDGVTTPKYSR